MFNWKYNYVQLTRVLLILHENWQSGPIIIFQATFRFSLTTFENWSEYWPIYKYRLDWATINRLLISICSSFSGGCNPVTHISWCGDMMITWQHGHRGQRWIVNFYDVLITCISMWWYDSMVKDNFYLLACFSLSYVFYHALTGCFDPHIVVRINLHFAYSDLQCRRHRDIILNVHLTMCKPGSCVSL